MARQTLGEVTAEPQPEVVLSDFDPEGEVKVVAAALYAVSRPARRRVAAAGSFDEPRAAPRGAAGLRRRPDQPAPQARDGPSNGRRYRFDILGDYGAFRDLQRHRMLTLEWQRLSTDHGYNVAEAIGEAGGMEDWIACHGPRRGAPRRTVRRRSAAGGFLRRADGLPGALLHGDERARGDARDRAAHRRPRATRPTAGSARRCTD